MNHRTVIARPGSPAATLRVYLLGKPRVVDGHGRSIAIPRKALHLFAYLILDSRSGRLTRDEAACLLWEDLDEVRRSGNFRQLFVRLRALAKDHRGLSIFDLKADDVTIGRGVVYTDIQAFQEALAGRSGRNIVSVCDAYGGELLEGQDGGGEKLSHWLRNRRAALHHEFTTAAATHLESDPEGKPREYAMMVAQKLLEAEPTHEAGHRTLMRLRAEAGDVKKVGAIYSKVKRVLRKEIQARPSQATRDLYATLLGDKTKLRNGARDNDLIGVTPAAPALGGKLPRVSLQATLAANASIVEREVLADFVNELCQHLWQSRSFIVSEPLIRNTASLWQYPVLTDGSSDYIIEIAQRFSARQLTLSIRLVSDKTREVLWAFSLNETSLHTGAVLAVVYALVQQIESNEIKLLSMSSENTTAHRLALNGQRLLQAMDLPSIRRARNTFRSALAVEPDSILALTGISRSFVLEGIITARADENSLSEARNLASRAVSLKSEDHRGHQALGVAHLYSHRFDKSLEHLFQAQRLSPGALDLSYDLADALMFDGQPKEAILEIEKVKGVKNINTDTGRWIVAGAQYLLGNYRAAASELSDMEGADAASRVRAGVHAMLGEKELASAYVKETMEFNPDFNAEHWASICPFRTREDREHSKEGLRAAGFVSAPI